MWELYCEEGWVLKNWCFWTVVLEKTLESPLDCKEIQPIHSEGDQLWDFFGRNDAKAETLVLWPPHAKSWLIGKDSDFGRDWGQEKKGTTEDEMAGWHHWLNGRESEWTPGVDDGQGGLACCDSWGRKESDMTERVNWTDRQKSSFSRTNVVFISIWKPWGLRQLCFLSKGLFNEPDKAMAPHSSTLAWKIPWTEEPGRLQSVGLLRVGHDWATSFHFSFSCIGEGNGNPLQCSCLENPRDGGA